MAERDARLQFAIDRLRMKIRIANGELALDGYPPAYHKALADIRARFAGRINERHVSLMARKFHEHPKMPAAYLQWPDQKKEWLVRLMISDQAKVEMERQKEKELAKQQWESQLQVHHMKEVDARPRGTNRDRVKLWLANVATPFLQQQQAA